MDWSARSIGVVVMSAGGIMALAAILIAGVAGIASQALVALAGGGFIFFLAGAALHDHNIDRDSSADDPARGSRAYNEDLL